MQYKRPWDLSFDEKECQVASSIQDIKDTLPFLCLSVIKIFYSKGGIVLFKVAIQYLVK